MTASANMEVLKLRVILAEYVLEEAAWRRTQAAERLADRRHRRCAAGLDELAGYILCLGTDDERLLELTRVCHDDLELGVFAPWPDGRVRRLIAWFRFDDAQQTPAGILRRLLRACVADKLEMAYATGLLSDDA